MQLSHFNLQAFFFLETAAGVTHNATPLSESLVRRFGSAGLIAANVASERFAISKPEERILSDFAHLPAETQQDSYNLFPHVHSSYTLNL